jgi:hypothetical protein
MSISRERKKRQQKYSLVILILLFVLYFLFFKKEHTTTTTDKKVVRKERIDKREKAFRHNRIYYTKHAKCRMDCRHIDESEVREILDEGEINYTKSELKNKPCPKYALEGITHDGQKVRIIVGDCESQASIITVIDLKTDYECECD